MWGIWGCFLNVAVAASSVGEVGFALGHVSISALVLHAATPVGCFLTKPNTVRWFASAGLHMHHLKPNCTLSFLSPF